MRGRGGGRNIQYYKLEKAQYLLPKVINLCKKTYNSFQKRGEITNLLLISGKKAICEDGGSNNMNNAHLLNCTKTRQGRPR